MKYEKIFGIIGRNISYSFSQPYFSEKFKNLALENYKYKVFDIQNIQEIVPILKSKNLVGLNVTIPYKEQVIKFLDEISDEAQEIGAVNTIKIIENKAVGYNTDIYGFKSSLLPLLNETHKNALILGTGGAAKAIEYALNQLNIISRYVSRTKNLKYSDLNKEIIETNTIIVNCSPVGTFPNIDDCPEIPYRFLSNKHLVYDLIYNPEITKFLKLSENQGAVIKNGYDMLIGQAEKSWEIWNQ